MFQRRVVYAIKFEHFQIQRHTSLIGIVYITLFDKGDPFIPTKREDYQRQTLKTLAPHDINFEESVCIVSWVTFGAYVQILFVILFDARLLVLGLLSLDLMLLLQLFRFFMSIILVITISITQIIISIFDCFHICLLLLFKVVLTNFFYMLRLTTKMSEQHTIQGVAL